MTSLLTDFNIYQNLYQTYKQTGCIDFKDFSNINPTTLLPLILNCFSDSNFDSNVKKDIKQYIKNQSLEEKILFEKIDSSYDFRHATLEHKYSNFIENIND